MPLPVAPFLPRPGLGVRAAMSDNRCGLRFITAERQYPNREGAYSVPRGWVLPVLPQPSSAEQAAVLYGNSIGLFCFLALDRKPQKEDARLVSQPGSLPAPFRS